MLNKAIAICLLLFFVAVKCTVLFSHVADQTVVTWSDHDEEQDEQEENKEPKQLEKQFDEFLQHDDFTAFNLLSVKLRPGASQSPINEYLSAPDLPPEVML